MVQSIGIILIGIFAGILFSLDLFYKTKGKGSFIKFSLMIFSLFIPAVIKSFVGEATNNLIQEKFKYFYISFPVTVFVCFLLYYQFIYKPL